MAFILYNPNLFLQNVNAYNIKTYMFSTHFQEAYFHCFNILYLQ